MRQRISRASETLRADQWMEVPLSMESAAVAPMNDDTTIIASNAVAVIVRKVLVKSRMVPPMSCSNDGEAKLFQALAAGL
jgi:hypothetical protein